jgi:hypothetical protein
LSSLEGNAEAFFALLQGLFHVLAFQKLTQLAPKGRHHLEKLVILWSALAARELHHSKNVASSPERNSEGAAETRVGGYRDTGQVGISGHIGDPDWLIARPRTPWQADTRGPGS